jgi:predicted secreted acid phosphatase
MPQNRLRTAATAAGATLLATALGVSMLASPASARDQRLSPRTHFTMAPDGSSGATEPGAGIPNIDSVKSTIRTYYGADTTGIANKTTSPYISEMKSIASSQWRYLDRVQRTARKHHKRPAIVFDADDTTLWTYDMEDAAMHFNFDPALQDVWVQDKRFPATPSMVRFVNRARERGFKIFGLTGRNDDQKQATLRNLHKVGYRAFNKETFFTKWTGVGASQQPSYIKCATTKCTTVEYKAGTRRHIEKLGYDIVLNVGDQWSDLQGGYADRVLKLPNPTYNLPSPDLDGTPADRAFSPRSHFTMRPDGSSGATQGGEGIPNIDVVKSTIRTYYNALSSGPSAGIADKHQSPYITELAGLTAAKRAGLTQTCADAKAAGKKPAIVFDADDTTLWTYDMEDAAMHFNFDPVLQDVWVQDQRFPATPGMVDLVNAVGSAGCTVVGLTGRNDGQKDATIDNLGNLGYHGFSDDLYFTKWRSGTTPGPARPWFAGTPCEDGVCTTTEYKSLTRAHVEDLGYRVVANFGDQFSDLLGGHADKAVKLPNPTYYLP